MLSFLNMIIVFLDVCIYNSVTTKKVYFYLHSVVYATSFQAIESVKQPGNHKVIDLFILLILHGTPRRKAVESLFRNKIRAGCFTDAYLKQVFSIHSQVGWMFLVDYMN